MTPATLEENVLTVRRTVAIKISVSEMRTTLIRMRPTVGPGLTATRMPALWRDRAAKGACRPAHATRPDSIDAPPTTNPRGRGLMRRIIRASNQMNSLARFMRGIVTAVPIALLSGCYQVSHYSGDGQLIDNGPFAATDRYVLNLSPVDLTQRGKKTFRMANLPEANFVTGFEISVAP